MGTTFVANTQLTTVNCNCGGVYAIQETYREEKHRVGGSWNCPYCQIGWGYAGNSENSRLKRELETANNRIIAERQRHDQTRAELRETERRRQAQKGVTTRIKNRVQKGVCPCCNRTFQNLAQHMAGQHPDFAVKE